MRVLVVDDDYEYRTSAEDLLKNRGHKVFGAWDTRTALDKASVVDVAFIDAWLDTDSGLKIIAEIRRLYSRVQVVLVTGSKSRDKWAEELGVESVAKESFATWVSCNL